MRLINERSVICVLLITLLGMLGGCERNSSPSTPSDVRQNEQRSRRKSTSVVDKAWKAYREDDFETVIKLLESHRKGSVDHPDIPRLLARAHYERNEFSKSNKQWKRAIPLLRNGAQLEQARKFERRTNKLVNLELDRFQYNHFTILLPSSLSKRVANEMNHQLERAYRAVGGDLSYFPEERFTVIIYRPGPYRRVIDAPIWSGGLFDGKIHVKYDESESPSYGPRVLVHEYAHAVVYSLARDNVPKWFNEGFATYQEHRQTNEEFRYHKLKNTPPQQTIESLSEINQMFGSGGDGNSRVRLGYEYSYSMIEFMKHQYGLEQVKRILKETGQTSSFNKAILRVINSNEQNLRFAWERWIRNRIR